jgi:hypothetical protein
VSGRPKWLSRDPIGEAGGLNLYAYVGNNPVGRIDPQGLWQFTIGGGYFFGGIITFGNNGGQWNAGVTVGGGEGLFFNVDPHDSGCHKKGRYWGINGEGDIGLGANVDANAHIALSEGDENSWGFSGTIPGTPISGEYGSEGAKFPMFGAGEGAAVGVGFTNYY